MSKDKTQGTIRADLQAVSLRASRISVGSYIVNDYVLTVTPDESGNGYTLTIRKGSEVQTIHLTELNEDMVNEVVTADLASAKASGMFDGYSPSVTVEDVPGGVQVSATDKNGTTSALVRDGKDGKDGEDGYTPVVTVAQNTEGIGVQVTHKDGTFDVVYVKDGFSPTASVAKDDATGVSTITLTDKNGTTTAQVLDGFSPTATVSKQDGTALIRITDKNGTTTAEISDGYSPTANVVKDSQTGISTITITDKNGTTSAQILDGEDGATGNGISGIVLNQDYTLTVNYTDGTSYTTPTPIRGEKGEKGDQGIQGIQGVQGIKGDPGNDYILTNEDKTEIADLVDMAALIDDTAGAGDTDKTWSASKITSELENAGSVTDVKINGTSIVDSETGEAEIPIATASTAGVVKASQTNGIYVDENGVLAPTNPTDLALRLGNNSKYTVNTAQQHKATFYGLARAAGDTTQSQSSNAVGTYTEEAKLAIRNMIDATGESATITVSGTDPVIQANRNTRYMCGEVLSLSFTPCATGICEVIFTAGSTLPVITLPQTVLMPEWFEIETDHTYDISIVDGVYGAVMAW